MASIGSTPNEGTCNFKKQWGEQSVQLYWQYLMDGRNVISDLSPSNLRYQATIRILQRLPLPATRVLWADDCSKHSIRYSDF